MKRTLIVTIVALILTAIISFFFFSKTEVQLVSMLPFLNNIHTKGTLSVASQVGILSVEIDDQLAGETPLTLSDLEEGTHKIKLTRKSTQENTFYKEHVFYVSIEPGTEAIINLEIGPDDNLHGYVLYYEKTLMEEEKGSLSVSGKPDSFNVKIDGELMGDAPYYSDSLWAGEYTLKFTKEKYESLEFPVVVEDGYNLNISTYMMSIPIKIGVESNGQTEE